MVTALMAGDWIGKEIGLKDISKLYEQTAGNWLLLEVIDTMMDGTPSRMKLLYQSPDKSAVHEFLMEDDDWDWQKQYLIVFSDPTKPCTISI
ncbi:MAG TPA: hypothetical protein ENJ29_13970 [Bacteroidetes bacterium]|nr:hypothetical protein [Bacteroidota bacterium]